MDRPAVGAGKHVLINGAGDSSGPALSRFGSHKRGMLLVGQSQATLANAADLCLAGKLRPLIDSTLPLFEAPGALARPGAGRMLGKVTILPGGG